MRLIFPPGLLPAHKPDGPRMLSPLVFCLLAPDDVPQPNAKRTVSGNIVPIASGGGVPCTRGRRGQLKNALYSTAMPGFDWGKWTKWLRPRKDGDARERCASAESSALPGHYTKLLALYPDVGDVGEKKHRGSVRKGARLLVNTHRGVRYADGSVGKMVGAGEHASYNGLVEARRLLSNLTPHPSPLTPTLTHSQPFKNETLLPRKRKRGGQDDVASALALAARGFEVFAGFVSIPRVSTVRETAVAPRSTLPGVLLKQPFGNWELPALMSGRAHLEPGSDL